MLGYVGSATYLCFESHWTDGLKAVFAVVWAALETVCAWILIAVGYGIALFLLDPASYPMSTPGIFAAVFFSLLASLPFLLHASVAAYARSR